MDIVPRDHYGLQTIRAGRFGHGGLPNAGKEEPEVAMIRPRALLDRTQQLRDTMDHHQLSFGFSGKNECSSGFGGSSTPINCPLLKQPAAFPKRPEQAVQPRAGADRSRKKARRDEVINRLAGATPVKAGWYCPSWREEAWLGVRRTSGRPCSATPHRWRYSIQRRFRVTTIVMV